MVEAMGLKGIEQYYNDPAGNQQEQPEEPQADPMSDPAVIKAQIDAQAKDRGGQIGAEKDIIIAQMQPPPELMAPQAQEASQEPQEEPDVHPDDANEAIQAFIDQHGSQQPEMGA
jgi:hypothetical protein